MRRGILTAILFCFFFSGAAGLIYQVAWGKALGLIFGHTVYAVATVLAVFMGGLALGSAWLGRWSERRANGVALYGWVELGVAAAGALSLFGLAGVRAIYLASYHAAAGSPATLLTLRFVGAAVVLFLPTFLMGGTLPILVRGLTRSSAELGARIGRLYWVNTAGAVAGTLAAGFMLLPAMGLRRTVGVAVALNVLAGATALLLSRFARDATAGRFAAPPTRVGENALVSATASRLLLVSFAAVGATAMAYEIGWTRLLATMLGSSTYAFTLMLATFLSGIVFGSAAFEVWLRRAHTVSLGTFARTQTLTALAALIFLVLFQQLPRVVPPLLRATQETFGGLVLAQMVTCALAMLPAALVFGFNFPAVTLLLAGGKSFSEGHAAAVGRAYAANTLGAIAGATATGFWLVPELGSFRVLALAAAVNLLLAVLLEWFATPRRPLAMAASAGLLVSVVTVLWTGAFYNEPLAHFGTVLYWNLREDNLSLAEAAATVDIVFAEDGLNASIAVTRTDDYLGLRTNGKVDASSRDVVTQRMVGHLGALFHAAPRRVLVIGFGSGMSVSVVALYPEVEHIDCVEIEPAVIRAAPYLETLNHGVLRDPRLHVILDDARNFLLTTRERYDLIISEPSNPWIAGVATLFTEEYYRAAKARLAPGGIFVQWVQAYSLYPQDLRMVLSTFVPQFPQVTLWHGADPDLILMARTEPAPLRLDRLRYLWSNAALRADYQTLGLRQPEGLLAFYLLDDASLRRLASGTLRNTDDHTRLEYRAPRALLAKDLTEKNHEMILQYQQGLLPPDLPREDRTAALQGAAETLLNLDEKEQSEAFLALLGDERVTFDRELLRARLALAQNHMSQAQAAFTRALRMNRSSLEAAQGLADVARRSGDDATAELLLRQVLARDADYVPALDAMALIERNRRSWQRAAEWQARRIAADPQPGPNEYCRLGEILMRMDDFPRAERALLEALAREPYSYAAHRDLGALYHDHKLWAEARSHLEWVLRFYPEADAETYRALVDLYRTTGKPSRAAEIARKGLRFFPQDEALLAAARHN